MENILEKVKYSFVLPAYKAKYLKEALDSIVNQTYTDFELIIVNDASPEDIDSIVGSYNDKRILYYKNQENMGGKDLVAQWNYSISYAKGEYLILASDDDIYSLEYLEKMDSLIRRYPDVNVFRPRVKRVDNTGKILQIDGYQGEYLTQIEYLFFWTTRSIGSGIPFYIFKRKALMDIGGFVNYPLAWFSDDATILKLSENGIGVYSTETLFSFRQSYENISSARNDKTRLTAKFRATRMFYDEHWQFINNYKPKNEEEKYMLRLIKKKFPKMIRKSKIKSQLKEASLTTILCTLAEGKKIRCNSVAYMLQCCKYPIRDFLCRRKHK